MLMYRCSYLCDSVDCVFAFWDLVVLKGRRRQVGLAVGQDDRKGSGVADVEGHLTCTSTSPTLRRGGQILSGVSKTAET